MNLARWSRLAEWGVLAAVVLLHVLLMASSSRWLGPPGSPEVLGREALIYCQPALILAWAVCVPGRWWLRLIGAPALLWLGLWWGAVPHLNLPDYDSVYFAPFAAATLALLILIRLGGLRMQTVGANGQLEMPPQFSIRAMIGATTAIAAIIGVLEYLRPKIAANPAGWEALLGEVPWFGPSTIRTLVMCSALALVSVGAIAAVLRPGAVWLRLVILAVAIPSLAGYLTQLAGITSEVSQRTIELTVAFAALASLTAVSVLPLRLFGYRLLRPASEPGRSRLPQRVLGLLRVPRRLPSAPVAVSENAS
jgi:hypothetical protein